MIKAVEVGVYDILCWINWKESGASVYGKLLIVLAPVN